MSRTQTRRRPPAFNPALLIGLTLVLLTLVVYYPVVNNQFVNLDDNLYVTGNPNVQAGLTRENIAWAFTSLTSANWHPLTMLSLLADSELSKKDLRTGSRGPTLFHLTNLILHCASTFVLFWVLQRMTGCLWRCAWVAALFSLHPLHVESVAWVAERKDVLSGLFWMLSLLAYLRYVEAPSWQRSLIVALMMAFGLLAKSMLVSLPVVFLLLDCWPLGRLSFAGTSPEAFTTRKPQRATESFWVLLRQKIPYLALSGLFCVIALVAQWQGESLTPFTVSPIVSRLQLVPVAYVVYLRKMLWPFDLVPFYPYPRDGLPAWQVACAALLLIGITVLAWRERLRRPYLLMGWLWYLVTLVPVIGLVQVGHQAYADRYTYLPLVGIFIMLAWGFADLITGWSNRRVVSAALAVCTLVACLTITRTQIGYWKDNFHLWEHTLKVSPENYLAHNNLGSAMLEAKKLDEAVDHFTTAVALNPKYDRLRYNLAMGLFQQGKIAQALQCMQTALQFNPDNDRAHVVLGRLCMLQGQMEEAVSHFQQALRLNPDNPGRVDVYLLLGQALMTQGNPEEAAQQFAQVTRLAPDSPDGHQLLGIALGRLQRWPEAAASLERAVELSPKNPTYRCDLALALFEMGEPQRSAGQYKKASELQPDWMAKFHALAGKLLEAKGVRLPEGQRALELATELCQASAYRNPQFLETLAAAYAATGQREKAWQTSQKAIELATASGQKALAEQIRERGKSYQDSRAK